MIVSKSVSSSEFFNPSGEPGLMLSKIHDYLRDKKLYKASTEETEKKMVRDAFNLGDCYWNSGDALVLDKEYFLYFFDRLGDTFRFVFF